MNCDSINNWTRKAILYLNNTRREEMLTWITMKRIIKKFIIIASSCLVEFERCGDTPAIGL